VSLLNPSVLFIYLFVLDLMPRPHILPRALRSRGYTCKNRIINISFETERGLSVKRKLHMDMSCSMEA
jgi:hypothetical protein